MRENDCMKANVFERPGQRRTCSGFAEGRKTILQKRTKNGREPIPAVLLSYANMRRNGWMQRSVVSSISADGTGPSRKRKCPVSEPPFIRLNSALNKVPRCSETVFAANRLPGSESDLVPRSSLLLRMVFSANTRPASMGVRNTSSGVATVTPDR